MVELDEFMTGDLFGDVQASTVKEVKRLHLVANPEREYF